MRKWIPPNDITIHIINIASYFLAQVIKKKPGCKIGPGEQNYDQRNFSYNQLIFIKDVFKTRLINVS